MKRNFLYLAVVTVAALAIVMLVTPEDDSAAKSAVDKLLLPGISEQINDVDRVEIVTAGDNTAATLIRAENFWQVEQMGGYRADWPKVQALLAALAQARVLEAKTDKPEYYARLGVEDIAAADAASVLVRIAIGDQATGILIGNEAQGRQGQYVRLQNAAGSALVDREFDVPATSLGWADTRIIDINASEVAEVEIIHPAAERLLVTKVSADQTDFELAGLSPDREIKSSWAVNSLGSVFSMLNMQTVKPGSEVDWTEAVKMRLLMFSGVEILADLVQQGDEYLIRLHASHPDASVLRAESEESGDETASAGQAAADVTQQVEDINSKAGGWAYGISESKFEAMVKKPEDLLKPLESS